MQKDADACSLQVVNLPSACLHLAKSESTPCPGQVEALVLCRGVCSEQLNDVRFTSAKIDLLGALALFSPTLLQKTSATALVMHCFKLKTRQKVHAKTPLHIVFLLHCCQVLIASLSTCCFGCF